MLFFYCLWLLFAIWSPEALPFKEDSKQFKLLYAAYATLYSQATVVREPLQDHPTLKSEEIKEKP